MMGHHRPIAAAALLVLGAGGAQVYAADWKSGSAPNYSGAPAQPDSYGRQQGYGGGSYRPTDSGSTRWQAPTWAPSTAGQGGTSTWNDQPQGSWAEPRPGQAEFHSGQYRFRQRPEDKTKKADDSPRYRPDPELTRRSQQFWGVPGQDPSQYGGAPGAVFRPLRPEQEPSSKPAAPGPRYAEPASPPWPGHSVAPFSGYGYPY